MIAFRLTRWLAAVALVGMAFVSDLRAQSAQPSAAAVALAKEIVELKGAITMFDGVLPGVIGFHRNNILATDALLQKDIDEVAQRLLKEYQPRRNEIQMEVARAYASRFTEAELRDILAFYKTPLGKKIINEEPAGVDEATKRVDAWSQKFAEEVLTRIRAEMKKKGHNL